MRLATFCLACHESFAEESRRSRKTPSGFPFQQQPKRLDSRRERQGIATTVGPPFQGDRVIRIELDGQSGHWAIDSVRLANVPGEPRRPAAGLCHRRSPPSAPPGC